MNAKQLTSHLQSRIARRANYITEQGFWKEYHHSMQQMQDYRKTKQVLKELGVEQSVDKRLLRMAQEHSYMDMLMKDDYVWLGGH